VCNKCQSYGHIIKDCKATTDTCGLCGKDHRTSTCRERNERKCTPCGSTDHPTNHADCPIYQQHERLMMDKNPEAISPYYLTNEEWLWGLRSDATDTIPPPAVTRPPRPDTNSGNRPTTSNVANLPPTRLPLRQQQRQKTLLTHFLPPRADPNTIQRNQVPIDLTDENGPPEASTSSATPQ